MSAQSFQQGKVTIHVLCLHTEGGARRGGLMEDTSSREVVAEEGFIANRMTFRTSHVIYDGNKLTTLYVSVPDGSTAESCRTCSRGATGFSATLWPLKSVIPFQVNGSEGVESDA